MGLFEKKTFFKGGKLAVKCVPNDIISKKKIFSTRIEGILQKSKKIEFEQLPEIVEDNILSSF